MITESNNQPNNQSAVETPVTILPTPDIISPSDPQRDNSGTYMVPPNKKSKVWITVATVILLLLGSIFMLTKFIKPKSNDIVLNKKTNSKSLNNPSASSIPSASPECKSPLAPANVRPHVRCYYRNTKISFTEAKDVQNRISQTVGSIIIPEDLVFVHEEVYRGIPIKWTNGQPISPNVLAWLKVGLDILPDYFYIEHPVAAIISATDQELGSQTVIKPGPSTLAYASGLNIFLTATTASGGSRYYPTNQSSVLHTLFHEWVHVVQQYEALQTFTEEYLAKNRIVEAMATGPLEKGYAREVGWVYNSDEFGDGIIAKLKDDAESQKTTEYGRSKVREDMAESGALFMECKSSEISETRTIWWEKMTGKKRSEFCPSKI